jgi:hypothetical protein
MRQRLLRPAAERPDLDPAGQARPTPPQIELVAGERLTTPSIESPLRERFDDGFLLKAGLAVLGIVGALAALGFGWRLLGL